MSDSVKNALRRAKALAEQLPRTRETSIVITKIEEALLWTMALPVFAELAAEDSAPGETQETRRQPGLDPEGD